MAEPTTDEAVWELDQMLSWLEYEAVRREATAAAFDAWEAPKDAARCRYDAQMVRAIAARLRAEPHEVGD